MPCVRAWADDAYSDEVENGSRDGRLCVNTARKRWGGFGLTLRASGHAAGGDECHNPETKLEKHEHGQHMVIA